MTSPRSLGKVAAKLGLAWEMLMDRVYQVGKRNNGLEPPRTQRKPPRDTDQVGWHQVGVFSLTRVDIQDD